MCASKINDWESEVDYNLRYNRWFLIPIGLWMPKENYEKFLFQFCIFFTIFMLMIYLIPHTLYILLVVKDRAVQLIMFGPLSYGIMAIGKYLLVLKHTRGIATCVNFIQEDWKRYFNKTEEKQLMIEAGRWVDNFTKLCIVFMIGGTMAHNVFLPLTRKMLVIIATPNATVRLVFPCYFGNKIYEDSSTGFMFGVLFFTHSLSFLYMNLVNVGLGSLMAKCVMHTCCQLDIMIKDLELTVNIANDDKWNYIHYQANLKLVVLKHLRILRFIGYTEETLTGVFFVEFISSTVGICVLGYYIIGATANNDIPQIITFGSILIAYIISIFIYCYLGNRLTDQCQQVGIRAYEMNWPNVLAKKKKNTGIQMIIMISQHPPMLTAGKIFFLTVETFTSIMKASAAYLNMLRTVTTVD